MTAHFEHRCRRCGAIFTNWTMPVSEARIELMKFTAHPEKMLTIHVCPGDGRGIADLLGYGVKEEEK